MRKINIFRIIIISLILLMPFSLLSMYHITPRITLAEVDLVHLKSGIDKEAISKWYKNKSYAYIESIPLNISQKNLEDYVTYISITIGDRKEGNPKEKEAGEWLSGQMKNFGYITVAQEFTLAQGKKSQNIIAYKENEFPEGKKTIIIGGHYDSVAFSPGAMDNGSGVAGLLEIARVVAGTKEDFVNYNIVFAFFGAEECDDIHCSNYYQGSKAYVAHITNEEKSKIAGFINLDVIGQTESLMVQRLHGFSDIFAQEVSDSLQKYGLLPEIVDSMEWSDHRSFERASIVSVFIHTPNCCFGHTPSDTYDKVHFERIVKISQGVIALLLVRIDK
jgi:Zn-dependent M28 family amino/carboxypeptidase